MIPRIIRVIRPDHIPELPNGEEIKLSTGKVLMVIDNGEMITGEKYTKFCFSSGEGCPHCEATCPRAGGCEKDFS